MRLKNKVALITGSARGIGQAIAELFSNEGAFVIVTDILDELGINLKRQLGENAEYLHLNVKNEENWIKIANHVTQKYGRLDILVNNAGITGFLETSGPFDAENVDLASWNEVQNINSTGVMLGCNPIKRFVQTPDREFC